MIYVFHTVYSKCLKHLSKLKGISGISITNQRNYYENSKSNHNFDPYWFDRIRSFRRNYDLKNQLKKTNKISVINAGAPCT